MISPLAKAQGRSSFRWVLFSICVFIATEVLIFSIYYSTLELLAVFFGWEQTSEKFWLTSFIYVLALVGGLLSVDVIRRHLSKQSMNNDEPPPPPNFS
jgi:uncharacterized membrane protein